MHWIKVEPCYVEARGPPLSTGVSFVRIDPGDWKLPQDNQRVSSSVFQRLPIVIVVGYIGIGTSSPKYYKSKNIESESMNLKLFNAHAWLY